MNNKWLSIILFSGIFSLIGFIFFLIGLLMFRHINKKEKRCILKTYGIVKDVVKHKSYNSDSVKGSGYYPVFEYQLMVVVNQDIKKGRTWKYIIIHKNVVNII